MKLPDIQRNLLSSFFQNEFKDSRDNSLRLSLLFEDVQAATRVNDRVELLFDDKVFNNLAQEFEDSPDSRMEDEKELFFLDMHLYQVTLYAFNHSGFKLEPTPDSDKLDLKDSEFKYSAYNITMVPGASCEKFVKNILGEVSHLDNKSFINWLIFISDHLEFKL